MPKLKPTTPAPPAPPLAPPLPRRAYSVTEASEILGLGQTSLRALIKAGKIKVVRTGAKQGGIIIPLASLDAFLEREAS